MRERELYVRHLPLSCTWGCTGGQPLPVVVLLSLAVLVVRLLVRLVVRLVPARR